MLRNDGGRVNNVFVEMNAVVALLAIFVEKDDKRRYKKGDESLQQGRTMVMKSLRGEEADASE